MFCKDKNKIENFISIYSKISYFINKFIKSMFLITVRGLIVFLLYYIFSHYFMPHITSNFIKVIKNIFITFGYCLIYVVFSILLYFFISNFKSFKTIIYFRNYGICKSIFYQIILGLITTLIGYFVIMEVVNYLNINSLKTEQLFLINPTVVFIMFFIPTILLYVYDPHLNIIKDEEIKSATVEFYKIFKDIKLQLNETKYFKKLFLNNRKYTLFNIKNFERDYNLDYKNLIITTKSSEEVKTTYICLSEDYSYFIVFYVNNFDEVTGRTYCEFNSSNEALLHSYNKCISDFRKYIK